MNKAVASVLLLLGLAFSPALMAQGRVKVKVINRENSSIAYTYAFVGGDTVAEQDSTLQGATLTLQLPNGDTAVVNCVSKFKERGAGGRQCSFLPCAPCG